MKNLRNSKKMKNRIIRNQQKLTKAPRILRKQ